MLKWTVIGRRDASGRPLSSDACNSNPTPEPKRRHSRRRRSSASRRHSAADKENQFASTPIKSAQYDALRDVSNIKKSGEPQKKKKLCTDKNEHFFGRFESVDSHIGGILNAEEILPKPVPVKRKMQQDLFAPTLPSCVTPIGSYFCKKPRIEHGSNFLQQICSGPSPEEDAPELNTKNIFTRDEVKVSPLVKQFVDLKFSFEDHHNDSSLINEMSLDRIVEAILDSSAESDKNDGIVQVTNSLDSGFKSSNTDNSHGLDSNFVCKCNKNAEHVDRTMINLNETYNERCVDDERKSRKRMSDKSEDDVNFTLKRQKCIRRRNKVEDDKKTLVNDETFKISDDASFNSISLDDATKKSTPVENAIVLTPVEKNKRFRRCLLFDSPTSLSESTFDANGSSADVRGSMTLNIRCENNQLLLNVIRCKDLYRATGKQINAYVKVALTDRTYATKKHKNAILQRTPVQADSPSPFFHHLFVFPLKEIPQQRLHIEVWHRDRSSRTSEFLGCMSFDVRHAYKQEVLGSYRLLPQSWGRTQNVPITPCSAAPDLAMSEDILSDELSRPNSRAVLSEQQKHADENLFLRYLELDPTEGPDAPAAATQRKATGNKNGRTPFTHTKRLTKAAARAGFGFSVVWTHPPRIERVEKGLPADKAGILPGDYVIFVDKHNVVMMPEMEILNLIRSYGSQLTLEIFRRNQSKNGSVPSVRRLNSTGTCSTGGLPLASSTLVQQQRRPSTVCSTNTASLDYRRKLHLPQVTFSAEQPNNSQEENRKRAMYQLIHKEQQYVTAIQFAITRFVSSLAERKDLITPQEHKILFQNCEELLRITEDIVDTVTQDENEPQIRLFLRTYLAKLSELTTAYKRYCSGIKKADCVLANKMKCSDFVRFIQTPAIPRRRPDLTTFIHKPLEHYREMLKFLSVIQNNTKSNHQDYSLINQIISELQATYKQITVEAGLMEPVGEGRPLLTVQDLENRVVFTKCKPFVLNKPGRQWIFGGDLGRVEGRNVRQYWTLLFNDLLLFAKVSRDRVLFVIEDPLPLANISDMIFNVRKNDSEFRLTVMPGGAKNATSPTVHCGPDLTRTPKKNAGKRTVVFRAPTPEMKAVWQNLLQRQIFQINSGMEGSAFSSPLETPDGAGPLTSSAATTTLQSAESLSFRRQTPQSVSEPNDKQKQIDALIEHKCKQLTKSNSGNKSNTTHLEKWMKDLDPELSEDNEVEVWTEEMLRQRSQELHLIDSQGNFTSVESKSNEHKTEERLNNFSDHEQSPSKSTTESQVTVRSSPVIPETVPVCRQCHKNCLANNNVHNDDWRPLLLMGLTAINPAASFVNIDPFAAPPPQIKVAPATPESSKTNPDVKTNCNCYSNKPDIDLDTPDDSPQTEEPPYHSLNSSNVTLRRFGTISSLERVGIDENGDASDEEHSINSEDEESDERGVDNDSFYQSSIRNWTAKAGSFVADKMSFFERLGEDYKGSGKFFERYLKTNEKTINGDDGQEDEASGATSGEEIWGTPTSGGEMDDPLSSPNYDGKQSPYDGSLSSDPGDDTELMMDELLMAPPVTGAIMRGLLPRRTLEPLIEEDCSETCSSISSQTPTEPSLSPEQGNDTGNVADTCSTAVAGNCENKMPRSESYRRIVEAAEELQVPADPVTGFFRLKPTVKFISIERIPRARSAKIFEFFNVRRERRIHQTIHEDSQLIKVFSQEGTVSDRVPTNLSPRRLKDKQLDREDRRFWKQLSKRRSSNSKPTNNVQV